MSYGPAVRQAVNYLRGKAYEIGQRIGDLLTPRGGLEFALAGVPSWFLDKSHQNTDRVPYNPLGGIIPDKFEGYFFASSNLKNYTQNGKGQVVVTRTDGKVVALNAGSVKHSEEDYVRKKLADNGMRPSSSEVKRIAKALRNGS